MLSQKSEFRFLDRGFKEPLVLAQGWACDHRIFDNLELDFNYILCPKLNTLSFSGDLSLFLNSLNIDQVSILGFSLGAYLGVEFAQKHPEKTSQLNLLGCRPQYQISELDKIKPEIKKNKTAWLYKFFKNCFSADQKEEYVYFRNSLLKEYTDNFNSEELIAGLDYLGRQELEAGKLKKIKNIRFFHGISDLIAPFNEIQKLAASLGAEVIRLEAGHFLFFRPEFKKEFDGR